MDRAAAEARVARAGAPLPLPAFTPNQVRLLTVMVCVALWEALARTGWFYRGVIPSTASVAVALGILFGARRFLWRCAAPYVNAIGSTPKIVFLPILFLLFGVGIESKMAKGALSAFFPVVVSTTAGMLAINPVWLRVGASFRLTRWQTITKIYLPAMVRPVVTGMRLGLGVGIIGVLVAEIKYSNGGLGYLAIQYYTQFDIPRMYAMLVIIFALAVLANWGMTRLTERFHWDGTDAAAERAR